MCVLGSFSELSCYDGRQIETPFEDAIWLFFWGCFVTSVGSNKLDLKMRLGQFFFFSCFVTSADSLKRDLKVKFWVIFFHQTPKVFRVIFMYYMSQLMNNNIIYN